MNLQEFIPNLRLVSRNGGGEYKGPCFVCGGKDRLIVHPEKANNLGVYRCRQCGNSGNGVSFLMDYCDLNYYQALEKLNVSENSVKIQQFSNFSRAEFVPAEAKSLPVLEWVKHVEFIAFLAHKYLFSRYGKLALRYLQKRGLKIETIKKNRLGYLPNSLSFSGEKFGFDEQKTVWFPAGISIPNFTLGTEDAYKIWRSHRIGNVAGNGESQNFGNGNESGNVFGNAGNEKQKLTRLRIRQTKKEKEKNRLGSYIIISGSAVTPMFFGNLLSEKPIMIVESEFDAMLLYQETSDLIDIVAIGSAQARPDKFLFEILKTKKLIISLDYDDAGIKETKWWLKNFKNAKNYPVPDGKDPGEAFQKNVNLRKWVGLFCRKQSCDVAGRKHEPKKNKTQKTINSDRNCLHGRFCAHMERRPDDDFKEISYMICLIRKESVFRFRKCPKNEWWKV